MLWYGSSQYKIVNLLASKYNDRLYIKNLTNSKMGRKSVNCFNNFFYIPANWELIIKLKRKTQSFVIYIYSSVFFIQFSIRFLSFLNVYYNADTSVLCLYNLITNSWFSLYASYLKQILNCFNLYFFTKIQFKGKGYRLYLNKRQTLAFQFGHSHRLYQYGIGLNLMLLTKYTLLVYGISQFNVHTFSLAVQAYRPINIYTHRGIRFAKQIIYKKTGKESSFR